MRNYDRLRYGTPEYREWNRERMRRYRSNLARRRRLLDLQSIRLADRTIAKLVTLLNEPHQEAT